VYTTQEKKEKKERKKERKQESLHVMEDRDVREGRSLRFEGVCL